MADKQNMKAKIWMYAVVLFTSAFIVLLITAYVQIKQQKNIDNYKTQISKQESENKNIQISYANAQEMISDLTGKNNDLIAENSSYKETIDKLNSELENIKSENQQLMLQYEKLNEAQFEYIKGNILESALILKNLNTSGFSEKTLETYKLLISKAYSEAGKKMFDEGYKLYQQSKYSEALSKLALSRDISKTDDYSDNCLYYLAYAQHRIGNRELALELMNTLIKDYPQSSFIKHAKNYINKYE